MLLFLQFPLAELRSFLNQKTSRLPSPAFPLPEPDRDFIRSFGGVRKRRKGGVEDWVGEETFCHAGRALRFADPTSPLKCAFRRILNDGRAVVRFEVGLVTHPHGRLRPGFPLDEHACLDLIETCLAVPVMIPTTKQLTSGLILSGEYLAHHYLKCTTRWSKQATRLQRIGGCTRQSPCSSSNIGRMT